MAIEARSPLNEKVGVYLLLVMEETGIDRSNNASNVNISVYLETRGDYAYLEYYSYNTVFSMKPTGGQVLPVIAGQ